MFRALVQRRVHGSAGKALVELAIGLGAAVVGVAARGLLVPLTGTSAPFALNFIAAVVATLFAGWRAGTVAAVAGQLLTWFIIVEPIMSFRLTDPRQGAALALATTAQLFLVGIIGRYQYEVDSARAQAHHEHELRGLLLFELKHRMKNTLALVQGLAQQTFRNQGIDEVTQAYHRRLNALGHTHDLLIQCEWTGAEISQVIEKAVYALVPNRERVTIKGPSLMLEPKSCLNLALVFHELTTNSVKYGAMSNVSGMVTVVWSNDPVSGFVLEWQETGGPPVHVPKRRGFGTRLIERAMASELNANVELKFEETGFSCVVTAPYFLSPASEQAPEPQSAIAASGPETLARPSTI